MRAHKVPNHLAWQAQIILPYVTVRISCSDSGTYLVSMRGSLLLLVGLEGQSGIHWADHAEIAFLMEFCC